MSSKRPIPKNLGGRPLKFKSEQELKEAVRLYFESCFQVRWTDQSLRDKKTGQIVKDDKDRPIMVPVKENVQVRPFTVTGLAVCMDTNRQTLMEYERGRYDTETDRFSDVIKNAKAIIEQSIEEKLHENIRHTGLIFLLKNKFDWRDRLEIDHSTKNKELGSLPDETQRQIKELNKRLAQQYEAERAKLL